MGTSACGVDVYLLPFAGGCAYSYRPLVAEAPAGVNCVPLELPGRASRIREASPKSLDDLVSDLLSQITTRVDARPHAPFSMFGHSMGALLAWLVTRELRRRGRALPGRVIVSGLHGPMMVQPRNRGTLSREALRLELERLGGSPAGVLADEGLYAFIEPIIRADFLAFDAFEYRPEPPLDVPFTVMIGRDDEVTERQARAWQHETTQPISLHTFPGGHFFIFTNASDVARLLSDGAPSSSNREGNG